MLAEKIPFFIVAFLTGISAVVLQSSYGAIAAFHTFSITERIVFAANGFILYLWKLVAPLNLSAFYPYPVIADSTHIVFPYFLSPVIALALIIIPFLVLKRRADKEALRVFLFGVGFFVVMIALTLQFVTVGIAAMADRYSYVSFIGLFFMLGIFIHDGFQKKQTRTITAFVTAVFSVYLMVNCYSRVSVWDNSEVLWTDVIAKYPFQKEYKGNMPRITQEGIATAYKNRASYYLEQRNMDKAFADYSVVAETNPRDAAAFLNLGNIYALQKQFDKVLEMYSKAIEADSLNSNAYANRGMTYSLLGNHRKGLDDLNKALSLAPANQQIVQKIAYVQMKLSMSEGEQPAQ